MTAPDPFLALSDPRRRAILLALNDGEQAVADLVAHIGIRQPEISKHLTVLRQSQLVARRRDGRRQLYRLDPEGFASVRTYLAAFEHLWNQRFDRLDTLLQQLQQEDTP